MNREIFPQRWFVTVTAELYEASLLGKSVWSSETSNGGRFVKRMEGCQYQDIPEGV